MGTVSGRVARLEAEAWRRHLVAVAAWTGVDAAELRVEMDRWRTWRAEVGEREAQAALAADLGIPVDALPEALAEFEAARREGRPIESVRLRREGTPCRA